MKSGCAGTWRRATEADGAITAAICLQNLTSAARKSRRDHSGTKRKNGATAANVYPHAVPARCMAFDG